MVEQTDSNRGFRRRGPSKEKEVSERGETEAR